MRVRWSPDAADDLAEIAAYIRLDNPAIARRVARDIFVAVKSLEDFPFRGRTGRVPGTRELPMPALPFIVVYRVLESVVEVINVIHGAQRWP